MRKPIIGILGGFSPLSTAEYYSQICKKYNEKAGGLEYPIIKLHSFNMVDVDVEANNKEPLRRFFNAIEAMTPVDFFVIASGTMHRVARRLIEDNVPVLDMRQVVLDELKAKGFEKVLLLGSKYTMIGSFYKGYLEDAGIEVVIPSEESIEKINADIYHKLAKGEVPFGANQFMKDAVHEAVEKEQVQAVVLACTEFSLLEKDFEVPVVNAMELHINAAVKKALE